MTSPEGPESARVPKVTLKVFPSSVTNLSDLVSEVHHSRKPRHSNAA